MNIEKKAQAAHQFFSVCSYALIAQLWHTPANDELKKIETIKHSD